MMLHQHTPEKGPLANTNRSNLHRSVRQVLGVIANGVKALTSVTSGLCLFRKEVQVQTFILKCFLFSIQEQRRHRAKA